MTFERLSWQVSITILDENDNSPEFDITSDTSVDIAENSPMGKKVAVVLGRDKDAGLNGLVRKKRNMGKKLILVDTEKSPIKMLKMLYVTLKHKLQSTMIYQASEEWIWEVDKLYLTNFGLCFFSYDMSTINVDFSRLQSIKSNWACFSFTSSYFDFDTSAKQSTKVDHNAFFSSLLASIHAADSYILLLTTWVFFVLLVLVLSLSCDFSLTPWLNSWSQFLTEHKLLLSCGVFILSLSVPPSPGLILTHYFFSGQFHSGGRQYGGCVQDQDSEPHLWGGLCQCTSGQRVSRPLLTEGKPAIHM